MIDTPLARLDDSHRTRLLHDFVPQASDQVVLLTTDAELDGRLLGQAEPWLARAYRLHFDARKQETIVVENNVADVNLVVERPGITVKQLRQLATN